MKKAFNPKNSQTIQTEHYNFFHIYRSRVSIPWLEGFLALRFRGSARGHKLFYYNSRMVIIFKLMWIAILEVFNRYRSANYSGKQSFIVVAHGYDASIVAMFFKILTRKRYVLIHHHPPYFWKRINGVIKQRVHKALYVSSINFADMIQALSNKSASSIKNSSSKVITGIRVIGHGISDKFPAFDQYNLLPERLSGRKIKVCMIGRLVAEKNYSHAINITDKLIAEGYDLELIIMGDGPERNSIQSMVDSRLLSNHVALMGFVNSPFQKLIECDLFLHTAFEESYSQVLIEAFVSRVPIVTTNVGVASELLEIDQARLTIISGTSIDLDADILVETIKSLDKIPKEISEETLSITKSKHTFSQCQLRTHLLLCEILEN